MAGLQFFYWPTPNGWKISIALEEFQIPYELIPVDIAKGDQFKPEFLRVNPNNRIPAILDFDVEGAPVPVFESGAILWYLATKYRMFLPDSPAGQKECLEWLFWQAANQGPMGGQLHHFRVAAPDGPDNSYALERYTAEFERTVGVLERRLMGRDYVLGADYTIADMMIWPWVLLAKQIGVDLSEFPNVNRWRCTIKDRPAVQRGVDLGKDFQQDRPQLVEESSLS